MRPKQILIIDDEAPIRESLKEVFEMEDYFVLEAANGEEGFQVLRKADLCPDLIILDLQMPVMDGATFFSEMKKQPELANIPIIIITAGASPPPKGAAGIIRKPFNLDLLLDSAAKVCENRTIP